jgi:hypothetical protein
VFFSEERTKRLLILRWPMDTGLGRTGEAAEKLKVFCVFSSEKKGFLT